MIALPTFFKNLHFCGNNLKDPFQTSFLAPYILKLPVKLKIKIQGNDRMSSKLLVLLNNYLELLKRSKIKIN